MFNDYYSKRKQDFCFRRFLIANKKKNRSMAIKKNSKCYNFSDAYYLSNFLDVQKESFKFFLKEGLIHEFNLQTNNIFEEYPQSIVVPGLQMIFYPEYYCFLKPKLTIRQAMMKRKTYNAELYIPIKFVDYKKNRFICDWFCVARIPLMTSNGHFIVNGLPRMIMSQIVRSPGLYFKKNIRANGISYYYTADFIAQRGSWLRLQTDVKKGEIWVKMKNEQKLSLLNFIRCLGVSAPVLNLYYNTQDGRFITPKRLEKALIHDNARGYSWPGMYRRNNFRTETFFERHFPLYEFSLDFNEYTNTFYKSSFNFFSKFSKKIVMTHHRPKLILNSQKTLLELTPFVQKGLHLKIPRGLRNEKIYETPAENDMLLDFPSSYKRLYIDFQIEYKLRLDDSINMVMPPEFEVNYFLANKFFDKRRYNLSLLGRARLNHALGLNVPVNHTLLTEQDILLASFYLIQCLEGKKEVSDIDHLSNRKIKPVGELLQNQVAIGLARLIEVFGDKLIKIEEQQKEDIRAKWDLAHKNPTNERLAKLFANELSFYITPQPINSALQEFFGSNPLSQMLDQTNPLAEITHKRRLSSLGIGGVNRQNAGMDIRGIHPTHYGRICPIETPEGQNAGLVNSFTIYSQLTNRGFIQTPFYQTYKGFLLREKGPLLFLPNQENKMRIAPSDLYINKYNFLPQNVLLPSRQVKTFQRVDRSDINYISVHPLQMISIATSLIPFLEHDDGNRALMGSNMQRQAVPTIQPALPIVGTGLESKVISDMNHCLKAKESGFISYVDSQKISLYTPCISSLSDLKHRMQIYNYKKVKSVFKQKNKPNQMILSKQNTDHLFQFQQKTLGFNSILKNQSNYYLSFLNSSQVHQLLYKHCQRDSLGIMYILSLLAKQKEYRQKKAQFSYSNDSFMFGLSNSKFQQQKIFMASAMFTLTNYFFSPNKYILNQQIIRSGLEKTISSGFELTEIQKKSPFYQFLVSSMSQTLSTAFLSKSISSALSIKTVQNNLNKNQELKFKFNLTINKHFMTFFEPPQSKLLPNIQSKLCIWLKLKNPNYVPTFDQKQNIHKFSKLIPKTLNTYEIYLEQKMKTAEKARLQNQESDLNIFSFKPPMYQSTLFQNLDVFQNQNQIQKNMFFKSLTINQPLTKNIFYKNLFKKPFKSAIFTPMQTMTYFSLNHAKFMKPKNHSLNTQPFEQKSQIIVPNQMYLGQQKIFQKEVQPFLSLKLKSYFLDSISRSNQDTYLAHRPIVKQGQWVEKGEVLADNSASSNGELSIGQNLLVGYTPWEGYNFEDAVLISDRVVSDELFSSIHVERYEINVSDTIHGIEEICRPPMVSRAATAKLDNYGIIKVGSWIKEGDILAGKITPIQQEESTLSNYEQLLLDILNKKELPFRDTSLRVPLNVHGRVVHVEILEMVDDFRLIAKLEAEEKEQQAKLLKEKKAKQRKEKLTNNQTKLNSSKTKFNQGQIKPKKEKTNFKNKSMKMKQDLLTSQNKVKKSSFSSAFNFSFYKKKPLVLNEFAALFQAPKPTQHNVCLFDKSNYSQFSLNELFLFSSSKKTKKQLTKKMRQKLMLTSLTRKKRASHFTQLLHLAKLNKNRFKTHVKTITKKTKVKTIKTKFTQLPKRIKSKKNLPQRPKRINIYIVEKRKLQIGDKIAGRHGNKGIVSNILPKHDMPYLPDGTPLDLVLNPLGVPSRMNVGQIFECLLGLAGSYLHQTYKIQPFDELYGCEASRSLVYSKLYEARIKTKQNWLFDPNFPGKVRLFDGRTGQCFEQPVTVGKAYILKLIHLVDEKIHARSTGPYSLVTQQPLRGRSNRGGQRLGEMEVWALEGFGAAYILQELLTIKSDDIPGREALLANLSSGKPLKFGPPESFRVLIRELESLCLDMTVFGPSVEKKPLIIQDKKLHQDPFLTSLAAAEHQAMLEKIQHWNQRKDLNHNVRIQHEKIRIATKQMLYLKDRQIGDDPREEVNRFILTYYRFEERPQPRLRFKNNLFIVPYKYPKNPLQILVSPKFFGQAINFYLLEHNDSILNSIQPKTNSKVFNQFLTIYTKPHLKLKPYLLSKNIETNKSSQTNSNQFQPQSLTLNQSSSIISLPIVKDFSFSPKSPGYCEAMDYPEDPYGGNFFKDKKSNEHNKNNRSKPNSGHYFDPNEHSNNGSGNNNNGNGNKDNGNKDNGNRNNGNRNNGNGSGNGNNRNGNNGNGNNGNNDNNRNGNNGNNGNGNNGNGNNGNGNNGNNGNNGTGFPGIFHIFQQKIINTEHSNQLYSSYWDRSLIIGQKADIVINCYYESRNSWDEVDENNVDYSTYFFSKEQKRSLSKNICDVEYIEIRQSQEFDYFSNNLKMNLHNKNYEDIFDLITKEIDDNTTKNVAMSVSDPFHIMVDSFFGHDLKYKYEMNDSTESEEQWSFMNEFEELENKLYQVPEKTIPFPYLQRLDHIDTYSEKKETEVEYAEFLEEQAIQKRLAIRHHLLNEKLPNNKYYDQEKPLNF